jgi:hypothetical protein
MRKVLVSLLGFVLMSVVPGTLLAEDPDAPDLKVKLLVQGQAQFTEDANVTKDGWDNEFFVRRARVILTGKVNKWINFFYETENANFGKNGSFGDFVFTQDAYVEFAMYKELKVSAGMLLLPFSHHNRQGATSLAGLDYHNVFSGKFITDKVWRDVGVEARGILFDMLDYRVGVFNGLRGTDISKQGGVTLNPDDMPRFTGRLAVNFFDVEDAFFYGGTYLGTKKVLSIGGGFDVQPDAVLDAKGELGLYKAFTGDVFADYPLNETMGITGQLGYVYFDRGYDQASTDVFDATTGKTTKAFADTFAKNAGTGMGAFGEVGFRFEVLKVPLMPIVGGEWYNSDVDGKDITNIRAGVNMFLKGHNANLKLEYANLGFELPKKDAAGKVTGWENDSANQVTLQAQLLF